MFAVFSLIASAVAVLDLLVFDFRALWRSTLSASIEYIVG